MMDATDGEVARGRNAIKCGHNPGKIREYPTISSGIRQEKRESRQDGWRLFPDSPAQFPSGAV
jgi:hypothetical protein